MFPNSYKWYKVFTMHVGRLMFLSLECTGLYAFILSMIIAQWSYPYEYSNIQNMLYGLVHTPITADCSSQNN